MSNAFDTATDANALSPAAANPVGKADAPASTPPSQSFDDLTDNDKFAKVGKELAAQERGIANAETNMAAIQKKRDEEDRARMSHMIEAEGITAQELKPWDAKKELNQRKTDLWEQFGSPGFVIAMIGSAFTTMPMNSALNAGAAAMNAINQGDMESYNKAFDAWKENAKLVEKRLDIENRTYEQLDKLRTTDQSAWESQMRAALSRFNHTRGALLLEEGMSDELLKIQQTQQQLQQTHAQTTDAIIQQKARIDALMGHPDPNGDHKDAKGNPMSGGDPRWYKGTDLHGALMDVERKEAEAKHPNLYLSTQDIPGAFQAWSDARGGVPPTQEMQALIKSAYATKGGQQAAKMAQVGNALAEIRTKLDSGEKLDDAAQEKILRSALQQPTSQISALGPDKLAELGWSPRAIDAAAETYNETGKLPTNLGTRQYAGIISGKIQDRSAEMLEEKGQTIEDRARNWQQYHTQQVAQNRFLSGPQGNTIRSLNVVVSHLQVLQDLSAALKNGEINKFNAVSQRWAEETGKPAPTNFDTAKRIVGTEIIKALGVAGAGTEAERTEAADAFTRARSPEQISGSIKAAQSLLVGQLRGLKKQFVTSTGLQEKSFDSMLEPQTRAFLGDAATSPGPKPSAVPVGANTKADPDGATYKKDGWLWKKDGDKLVPMQQLGE